MIRDKSQLQKRQDFVKLAIDKPKLAAEKLRLLSISLDNCRKTTETVECLMELFCVSEKTIYNDITATIESEFAK